MTSDAAWDGENINLPFRRLIEMYLSSKILNDDLTNCLKEAGVKQPQTLLQQELQGTKDIVSKNMKGFKSMSAITLLRYVRATQIIMRRRNQKIPLSCSLDRILEKYDYFITFYENPPDTYAIESHELEGKTSLEKYEEEVIIKLALYFKKQKKFLNPEEKRHFSIEIITFITYLVNLPFVKRAEKDLNIEKIKHMKRGTK